MKCESCKYKGLCKYCGPYDELFTVLKNVLEVYKKAHPSEDESGFVNDLILNCRYYNREFDINPSIWRDGILTCAPLPDQPRPKHDLEGEFE